WLKRLGFRWYEVQKNVFIDGDERSEVVKYRDKSFFSWSRQDKSLTCLTGKRIYS
ncbi:hypothetical protein L873DRAFT_1714080, partial [Choiromyces venosus 120613-1]